MLHNHRPQARLNFNHVMASSSSTRETRPIVFMDVNVGETSLGRVKFQLYS